MTLNISEHSPSGWQSFAQAADFVPDPMILRAGEVFANGAAGVKALGTRDMEVVDALKDNVAGLIEFFDMIVIHDRVPLINYQDSFAPNSVSFDLATLLGAKALSVEIGGQPYYEVKTDAVSKLSTVERDHVRQFGHQLAELRSLRYDWRPSLEHSGAEGWLAEPETLDESTRLAAEFLLGGLIFSGFAQASFTDHIIQPKRSRFFLALTAARIAAGGVTRADEDAVFNAAEKALAGTAAKTRRLAALPPVLPYLLAKAPPNVSASDLVKRALDFANTKDGEQFRKAAAIIRGDGVRAFQTVDMSKTAQAEARALLSPYSNLADAEGGLQIEVGVGLDGPSVSVSKTIAAPAWLQIWWNTHTPFGGLRKTFRRMWLTTESFGDFEKRLLTAWAQP